MVVAVSAEEAETAVEPEAEAESVAEGDSRAAEDGEKIGMGRMPVPEGLAVDVTTVALPAVSVCSALVGSGRTPVNDCRIPVSLSVVLVLALAAVVLADVARADVADSVTEGDPLGDTVLSVMIVDRPMSVRPEEVALLEVPELEDALSPELGPVGAASEVGAKKPVPAEPLLTDGLLVMVAELRDSDAEWEESDAEREEIVGCELEMVGGTITGGRPLFDAPKMEAKGTSLTELPLEELPTVGWTSLLGTGPPVDPKIGRAG